jgi:hypothetical protein
MGTSHLFASPRGLSGSAMREEVRAFRDFASQNGRHFGGAIDPEWDAPDTVIARVGAEIGCRSGDLRQQ